MSSVSSYTSLKSNYSLKKNKKPFVPTTKAIIKDKIVSSTFNDVKPFVPSFMKTELKPEINSLITMEYSRIWQEEHKMYQKNVIEEKLNMLKKKPFKRPTFQSKNCSTMADAGDVISLKRETKKGPVQVLNSSKQSKPLKSVWK